MKITLSDRKNIGRSKDFKRPKGKNQKGGKRETQETIYTCHAEILNRM